MPEAITTFAGSSFSSARAWYIAVNTEKSPQPGHHTGLTLPWYCFSSCSATGLMGGSPYGMTSVSTRADLGRPGSRGQLPDLREDFAGPEGQPVVLVELDHRGEVFRADHLGELAGVIDLGHQDRLDR